MPRFAWQVKATKEGANGRTLVALESLTRDELKVGDVLTVLRPSHCPLTSAQCEILEALAEGKTYKQIAAARERSVSTVRSQLFDVYRRLKVPDRANAVLRAKEEGWI